MGRFCSTWLRHLYALRSQQQCWIYSQACALQPPIHVCAGAGFATAWQWHTVLSGWQGDLYCVRGHVAYVGTRADRACTAPHSLQPQVPVNTEAAPGAITGADGSACAGPEPVQRCCHADVSGPASRCAAPAVRGVPPGVPAAEQWTALS